MVFEVTPLFWKEWPEGSAFWFGVLSTLKLQTPVVKGETTKMPVRSHTHTHTHTPTELQFTSHGEKSWRNTEELRRTPEGLGHSCEDKDRAVSVD